MKKTYIKPNAIVVTMEYSNILADSDINVSGEGNGADALSKRNIFFDDED